MGHTDVLKEIIGPIRGDDDIRDKGSVLKELLNRKRQETDSTPLHLAAWGGRADVVQLLVNAHGVDVNASTKGGETPLFRAA